MCCKTLSSSKPGNVWAWADVVLWILSLPGQKLRYIHKYSMSHISCSSPRSGPVLSLKMQIRTMTTPPTVSSCTWTWGMKCVYSWMGAKFTEETPTNTAPSPASSSTQTDSILTFLFSLSLIKRVSSPLHLTPSVHNVICHFNAVQYTKRGITWSQMTNSVKREFV